MITGIVIGIRTRKERREHMNGRKEELAAKKRLGRLRAAAGIPGSSRPSDSSTSSQELLAMARRKMCDEVFFVPNPDDRRVSSASSVSSMSLDFRQHTPPVHKALNGVSNDPSSGAASLKIEHFEPHMVVTTAPGIFASSPKAVTASSIGDGGPVDILDLPVSDPPFCEPERADIVGILEVPKSVPPEMAKSIEIPALDDPEHTGTAAAIHQLSLPPHAAPLSAQVTSADRRAALLAAVSRNWQALQHADDDLLDDQVTIQM
jgi:hypothetical protein